MKSHNLFGTTVASTRSRKAKKRYGVTKGKQSIGIHTGLKSTYLWNPFADKPLWSLPRFWIMPSS